tara:strand:- start:1611 stop:1805 length:195 start_codon:yes stop_codon:yes gene_type:complete
MEHTLTERITMMLKRMETYYGPHRIRRMSKDEINKMSMLYGVSLDERDESYKILEDIVIKKKKV